MHAIAAIVRASKFTLPAQSRNKHLAEEFGVSMAENVDDQPGDTMKYAGDWHRTRLGRFRMI